MASSVKSKSKSNSKNKKERRDGNGDPRVDPLRNLSAQAEWARRKLHKLPEHRNTRPNDLKRLAVDLTDKERLRTTWFETPHGHHQDGGQGVEQAAATPAGRRRRVSVKLFLAQPLREDREHTLTGSVATGDSTEAQFEQFCSYGICSEAALLVEDQYLKWVSSSLVIPRGEKIRDNSEGAQPLSLGDEAPVDLGDTDKLDDLLQLVARYNGSFEYHAITRNSKVFVCDALQKLGKRIPPLLVVFENYRQRIADATNGIRKEFGSHKELDDYFKDHHAIIVRNERNIEYLLFLCVCFHVRAQRLGVGMASGRHQICTGLDCCLPFLLTNFNKDTLMFRTYWQTFCANGLGT